MPTSYAYRVGMDSSTVWFWCVSGTIVSGIVGYLRHFTIRGMGTGFIFGPLFGPILVMLMTLGDEQRRQRRLTQS